MNSGVQRLALIVLGSALVGMIAHAQDSTRSESAMKDCPMHKEHMSSNAHHKMVQENGDQAMGFPHDQTTHHFRISATGGSIEVTANDPADKTNTAAIRSHLTEIADLFHKGDFAKPMFTHSTTPPGVTTMKLLTSKIRYHYEEIPSGARVDIDSDDPVAVAAIHDFLRFQIAEHQTGDSSTLGETP